MKIAVSGKGGVGKSTVSAALALLFAQHGQKVLAVDADPDANLASCLGIDEETRKTVIPISHQRALIEERTGAKVREYGQIFKLNPQVSDITDTYAITYNQVSLLTLGSTERGGSGCACPENVLIRALVTDLILYKDQVLIMDMEAGIEHLGRATARGVDILLIVVEPGQRSIETARRVLKMANDIGLRKVRIVANKVASPKDEGFIRETFPNQAPIGFIPYSEQIRNTDRDGQSVLDGLTEDLVERFEKIRCSLAIA